nr:MAG TPA: hypothetical protein [Caudoviricetes sp.]
MFTFYENSLYYVTIAGEGLQLTSCYTPGHSVARWPGNLF